VAGVQVIGTPSAVTDDDFVWEKLGEIGEAEQTIYGYNHKKERATWRFPLDIDERPLNKRSCFEEFYRELEDK
jgi:hypothetical protein